MGKNKLLAGLAAGVLVSTALATTMSSTSAAAGGGNDALFTLSNNSTITITDNTTSPVSSIVQYGMSTTITDVNVTLNGIAHTFPDALDIEVVGPDGTAVALMSDVCGGGNMTTRNFTFDDQAAASMPDAGPCGGGSYKPTNINDGADTWAVTPTGTTLAAFNGKNPNATLSGGWRLYVRDEDGFGDTGSIATGWSIGITTASSAAITVPAFGSSGSGVATPYPFPVAVNGKSGLITDVNITVPNVWHTWPADMRIVAVSPTGKKVTLMNNNCSSVDLENVTFTFDDQAAAAIPVAAACTAGTFKVSTAAATSLPGPAPASPYGTSLSVFNGDSPNGTWNFFIDDTVNTDGGFLGAPTLTFTTTDVIAPNTLLVGKKPGNTTKTKAKIKFRSTEAGSTFKCKVDSKAYKPCTSPLKLKNLKVGKHKVLIVATDLAGNKDPKALKVKWRIFP